MTEFCRNVRKRLSNLKLEYKILLATVCINVLFVGLFLFVGVALVTSRYDNLLYQQSLNTSALVSRELSARLDELVTMSNVIRTDSTVQSTLDDFLHPKMSSSGSSYSNLYSQLQQYYLEYRRNYVRLAAISCSRFNVYTYSHVKDRPDQELLESLNSAAVEASGSPCWISDKATGSLYLVREIKKIENLSLEHLGTLFIKVDVDDLIREISRYSDAYADSYWVLYDEDALFYSSPELTEESLNEIRDTIQNYGIIHVNGQKFFAVRGDTKIGQWDYVHLISYENVAASQSSTLRLYVLILILSLGCSVLFMHLIMRQVTKHFDLLILKMNAFKGDSEVMPSISYDYSSRKDEIGTLHQQFDSMVQEIQMLVLNNYKKELLMKDAQIKSLESQINPHFLYNTLDTVNWRAKAIGEKNISQIVESLGHFLRITLNRKSDNFSLREELDIIHYYMTIQQLRFDNRLTFRVNVPEIWTRAKIPKLSIQPLIENAVHYALEEVTEECIISLSCVKSGDNLEIYVKNTGSEFAEDLLEKLRNHVIREKGLGIALLNIEERIKLMFGRDYGLSFYNEENYAVVKMTIPFVVAGGSDA